MHLRVKLGVVLAALLAASFTPGQSNVPTAEGNGAGRPWYLLVWRGGTPIKNYYKLLQSPEFLEPQRVNEETFRQYTPSPGNYGFDVSGYGIYQAWRVSLLGTSDTTKAPASTRDGVYVLSYPRNPEWVFCATRYNLMPAAEGSRKLTYTDFQDGRQYTIELSVKWPRPWQVQKIEIIRSNIFLEIWQASQRP